MLSENKKCCVTSQIPNEFLKTKENNLENVVSCGTDHQLQSVMIIYTVHQVHKNLIDVCITGKASVGIRNRLTKPAIQT